MLFDGGVREARVEDLEGMLNAAFDEKLSSINSKAAGLILNIEQAKALFVEACDHFDRSTVPPDRESIRAASESYVIEQKSVYTGTLRRLIAADRPADDRNLYTSYHSKLASAKALMDEVLKANNKFRIVLEAYANELGRFKNAYTGIERSVKELGLRLDSKANELNEYNSLLQEIERLAAFDREAAELARAESEIGQEPGGPPSKDADAAEPMRRLLSEKRAEIGNLDKAAFDARGTIMARLAPLEKPARKYEHGTTSKMHLTYYLEDPVGTLSNNENAMREFSQHVISLKKEIQENRIVAKNTSEAMHAIDFVLHEDISSFIEEIRILKSKRDAAEQEAAGLERLIREIDRAEGEKKRKVMAASEIKEELKRISAARDTSKSKIEGMFERFYKRKIRIIG